MPETTNVIRSRYKQKEAGKRQVFAFSFPATETTFGHAATASNGWHAIVVNGQVGWVSGKYSRMI